MAKRIIVVGGGPGGYVAAIRAAQLGAEVHLVEEQTLGGTCLNVGCIPTKALLHTAEIYRAMKKGALIGLKADNLRVDWKVLQARKQAVVTRLVKGVEALMKANKIFVHNGRAVLTGAHSIRIEGAEPIELQGSAIILATGSQPARIPFPGADLPGVVDSTDALNFPQIPKSLIIIGGGVIGVEFAALYSTLGVEVTVVELMPEILPGIDAEISVKVRQELTKNGVDFMTGSKLVRVAAAAEGLKAVVTRNEKVSEITGEYVLVAVGRRAAIQEMGLEALKVELNRGRIVVNEHFETNISGLYAVGDCNGELMLAHAASAQGVAAVEHALGHRPQYCANTIPACIYTDPEVASVGLTEEQVQAAGLAYTKGIFPLTANGKAIIESGGAGMVKLRAETGTRRILGVHIFGPWATDMIGEAALAIRLEATVEDIISTIHAHPTVSESIGEAALASQGLSIHWPPQA